MHDVGAGDPGGRVTLRHLFAVRVHAPGAVKGVRDIEALFVQEEEWERAPRLR